jgi:predicted RNase H-like HicB family nuclease
MDAGYSIYVVPDQTTDGAPCYVAYHPELQGCMSHGATIDEAVEGLDAARELYLATLKDLGQPIPAPSERKTVAVWENLSVALTAPDRAASAASLPTAELTPSR